MGMEAVSIPTRGRKVSIAAATAAQTGMYFLPAYRTSIAQTGYTARRDVKVKSNNPGKTDSIASRRAAVTAATPCITALLSELIAQSAFASGMKWIPIFNIFNFLL